MTKLAGLELAYKRIDRAVKAAVKRDARPKRSTAAQLLREARLKGLIK